MKRVQEWCQRHGYQQFYDTENGLTCPVCVPIEREGRYYPDEDDGDWYVFDSSVEPHKAVSSWSSAQDAEDDAARRNESEKELAKPEGLHGIELLRYAAKLFDKCNETFNGKFTVGELLIIAAAHKECKWDYFPDQWTEQQIAEAIMHGAVPEWEEEK